MKKLLNIDFDCKTIYNYSMACNNISLIDSIILENISDYEIKNIELEILSEPEFFDFQTRKLPNIESQNGITIEEFIPECDIPRLCYTKLPYSSKVTLRIKKQDEIIEEESKIVEILPYDYFPCAYAYTETGAALVTPRQPELSAIIDETFKELKNNEISIENNYYGKSYVMEVFRALYRAVKALKITYNTSSVSIETKPIKIKLCESVIKSKSANALEIALLFASAIEALGLNPILIISNTKPLVGCFTENISFMYPINDDGHDIYDSDGKLCDKLCIIDPTCVANGTNVTFDSSVKMAESFLENTDTIPVILDIACSRKNKLAPLPNRVSVGESLIFEESENYDRNITEIENVTETPDDPYNDMAAELKGFLSPSDTSNPLICLDTSTSVFLVSGNMDSCVKAISIGERVPISSFVLDIDIDKFINSDPIKAVGAVSSAIDEPELIATHSSDVLTERLENILGKEIYLACGLLEYSTNSNSVHIAPVILLPVTLSKQDDEYVLYSNADAKINKCLFEYMKKDMGITVHISEIIGNGVLAGKDRIFDEIMQSLSNYDGFILHNFYALAPINYSSYELSLALTPQFVKDCELLNSITTGERIKSNEVQPDSSFALPLDLSQRQAATNALNNKYTLISGTPKSGKTETLLALTLKLTCEDEKKNILFVARNKEKYTQLTSTLTSLGINECCLFFDSDKFNTLPASVTCDKVDTGRLEYVEKDIKDKNSRACDYYTAVHKIRDVGFSFFEAVSQFERYRSFPYTISFTNDEIKKLSKNDVVNWFDIVSALAKAGADCKEPFNNPLSFINLKEFSYEIKSEISDKLTRHLELTHKFTEKQTELAEYLGIDVSIIRESQTASLMNMLKIALVDTAYICRSFFLTQNKETALHKLKTVIEYGNECLDIENKLSENFTDEILELDAKNLILDWRASGVKFALQRMSIQASIKNRVKTCTKPHYTLLHDNILDILYLVAKYREYDSFISENSKDFEELFEVNISAPKIRKDKNTWKRLEAIQSCLERYSDCIYDIYSNEKKADIAFEKQAVLFKNPSRVRSELKEKFGGFEEFYKEYIGSENSLGELLGIDFTKAREKNASIWYFFIINFLNKITDNIDNLKYWCAYRLQRERAIDAGLRKVVEEYENVNLSSEDMKNAFLKGFFKAVSEYILSCEPSSLGTFSNDAHAVNFEEMRERLSEYTKLCVGTVKEAFSKRLAHLSDDTSSFRKLYESLQNPQRRKTDSEFWQSILSVYKITVTNGDSILKYLDSSVKFDTVIIDDAETFTLSRASIFMPYAHSIVAAGTPFGVTQLREGGFIDNTKKSDRNFFDEMAKTVEVRHLDWKYGSPFVYDIINNLGHDSRLCGFPKTAKEIDIHVQVQNGNYDRKNTRTNTMEASAAVEELIKLIKNGVFAGIYAMTEEQAELIREMLKKKIGVQAASSCLVGSVYDDHFEERDVIIFSTTYALDERPKYKDSITRNLGVITDDNCKAAMFKIFALAKRGFLLITSLSAEIISKLKTTSKGYSDFKKIMHHLFDKKSKPCIKALESAKYENAVIHEIGNEISKKGYRIFNNLKVGNFRIDLAVKDRDDKYLLGIIFDDTACTNAASFDIAVSQIQELEKLGWHIIRVFSVEWFENNSVVMDRINRIIENHSDRTIDLSIIQN